MKASQARVALLTNFLPPYRLPVLEALAERVAALKLLVSTPMEGNRDWSPRWEGLDVAVQRTLTLPRVWRHPSGFRETLPLHIPLDTRRRLRSFGPDIVITAELGSRSLQAVRWSRVSGGRLVIWATLSERTESGRGRAREALRRYLLARADGVVVNGESGARYVIGLGYPPERVYRVAQASPVVWAGDRPEEGGDTLELLYVGQLVERKGIGPLVDGLERWARARGVAVRLTIVGPGTPAAGAPASRGPLDVRYTGPVPFDELAIHYAAADLLVFPTLADEWGLVVNEAMASGLPVLGSVHSQAVTELVEEGRTGWWYDPEKEGELEAALDAVATLERGELRRMGAAARRRVSDITPERMGERLAAVLDDVLARDRRRP